MTHRMHILILATAVALIVPSCADTQENDTTRPLAVRTLLPERRDLSERIDYLGTVHSATELQVHAQLQGSIVSMPFEEGDAVRKGATLVRLGAPEIEAAVDRARAEREYWCRRSEADERLLARGAIAAEQVEAGRRACANAETALREAEARRDKTVEHAPVSGVLLRRFAETGQNVMPGQPLLLVGSGDLLVHVGVVEEDLRRGIAVGMRAELVGDAGTLLPARVVEMDAVAASASRTYTVKLRADAGATLALRHGSSVQVRFLLRARNDVIAVPVRALVDRNGDAAVFLVRGDRVRRQRVTTGIEDDGWVEASFPWNGRDAVAVTNLAGLSDSVRVLAVTEKEIKR